ILFSSASSVPLCFKGFGFHARLQPRSHDRRAPQHQCGGLLGYPARQQAVRHAIHIHHHRLLVFHRQYLQLLRPVAHHLRVPVTPPFSSHLRRSAASPVDVLVLASRSLAGFLEQLHLPLYKRLLLRLILSSFRFLAYTLRLFRFQQLLLRVCIHLQRPVLPVLPSCFAGHALGLFCIPQSPLGHLPPPSRRVRGNVLHHPFGRIIFEARHISHSPWQTLGRMRIFPHRRPRRNQRDFPRLIKK